MVSPVPIESLTVTGTTHSTYLNGGYSWGRPVRWCITIDLHKYSNGMKEAYRIRCECPDKAGLVVNSQFVGASLGAARDDAERLVHVLSARMVDMRWIVVLGDGTVVDADGCWRAWAARV